MFLVKSHVRLTSVTKRKSFITLIIGIDVISFLFLFVDKNTAN